MGRDVKTQDEEGDKGHHPCEKSGQAAATTVVVVAANTGDVRGVAIQPQPATRDDSQESQFCNNNLHGLFI